MVKKLLLIKDAFYPGLKFLFIFDNIIRYLAYAKHDF